MWIIIIVRIFSIKSWSLVQWSMTFNKTGHYIVYILYMVLPGNMHSLLSYQHNNNKVILPSTNYICGLELVDLVLCERLATYHVVAGIHWEINTLILLSEACWLVRVGKGFLPLEKSLILLYVFSSTRSGHPRLQECGTSALWVIIWQGNIFVTQC